MSTNISLDGLQPFTSFTLDSGAPSGLHRVQLPLALPQISNSERGVFVVDVVGAGLSSRALLRKGCLRGLLRTTAGGQALVVVDESGAPVDSDSVSLWLEGRLFTGKKEIFIPFSTTGGGAKTGVLTLGGSAEDAAEAKAAEGGRSSSNWPFSSLFKFQHSKEEYELSAAWFLDRECLTRGNREAKALLRTSLSIAGVPCPLSLLRDVSVRITTVDSDGTVGVQTVEEVKLEGGLDTVLPLSLPLTPRNVTLEFTAFITPTAAGAAKQKLTSTHHVSCSGIDRSSKTDTLFLSATCGADGTPDYYVSLLGKAGEPRPGQRLSISVNRSCLSSSQDVVLRTDASGRVRLGPLRGVKSVTCAGPDNLWAEFQPTSSSATVPLTLTVPAATGEHVVACTLVCCCRCCCLDPTPPSLCMYCCSSACCRGGRGTGTLPSDGERGVVCFGAVPCSGRTPP